MSENNRREFLKVGLVGGLAAGLGAHALRAEEAKTLTPTPSEIEGPFYPVVAQKDKDFDLTQIQGKQGKAKGEVYIIEGRVVDTQGKPIEDATLDVWQANAAGRYRHPHDTNDAPLDDNFQGWAIVKSGKQGGFKFKTIRPGAYPVSKTWTRPPHIHFKVSKRGYVELITQMYFPSEKLNAVDRLLQRKQKDNQQHMIAKAVKNKKQTLYYEIVLAEA